MRITLPSHSVPGLSHMLRLCLCTPSCPRPQVLSQPMLVDLLVVEDAAALAGNAEAFFLFEEDIRCGRKLGLQGATCWTGTPSELSVFVARAALAVSGSGAGPSSGGCAVSWWAP